MKNNSYSYVCTPEHPPPTGGVGWVVNYKHIQREILSVINGMSGKQACRFYKIWENYEKSQGRGFFALLSIFLFDVND